MFEYWPIRAMPKIAMGVSCVVVIKRYSGMNRPVNGMLIFLVIYVQTIRDNLVDIKSG